MKKIIELLGIIKGINYDSIINEKEVECLQSWLENNEYLVHNDIQSEIVTLMKQVLEDKIITKSEYDKVRYLCETVVEKRESMQVDNPKLYELNGILEGIICDEEINVAEIEKLRSWIKANKGERLLESKSLIGIKHLLHKLLEVQNDFEGSEEYVHIINEIKEKIIASKVESKIDNLKSLISEKRNIGFELIDLIDDKEAVKEIHKRAEKVLINVLESYTESYVADRKIILISLALIAIEKYDGNFYAQVEDTYTKLYAIYKKQKIEGNIRSILKKYGSLNNDETSHNRIINEVLLNTLVPGVFLKPFFEFIFDIYKLNFNFTLSDNLEEDFKFVYEGLHSSLAENEEGLKLNLTRKTYKLIKPTKELIICNSGIDEMIKLSIVIVKIIDKTIWGNDINITNSYLKKGYEGWLEVVKKDNTDYKRVVDKSTLRSRWKPELVLWENDIYLIPPTHRIKEIHSFSDIYLEVINGNETIYQNYKPDIREIIGGYQIKQEGIKISLPLGRLQYRILAGKEVIFDSKEQLFREFIVFDDKGNEIINNTDYSGDAKFCLAKDENTLNEIYNEDNYNIAYKNVNVGDAIRIGNELFCFSSVLKPYIKGNMSSGVYLNPVDSNERIEVYKKIDKLIFETTSNKSLELIINGKLFSIEAYHYELENRGNKFRISINLPLKDDGVYDVKVFENYNELGSKKLFEIKFALDQNMYFEIDETENGKLTVYVESGILKETLIKEFEISNFDINWMSLIHQGIKYNYLLPFPFKIYRLNSDKWSSLTDEIYIGEIKKDTILELYGISFDEARIYSCAGEELDRNIKLKNIDVTQQMHIGFLISYKQTGDYTVIWLLEEDKVKGLIYCYNKCVINLDKTEIYYNSKDRCLDVVTSYFGKGNIYFTVTNSKNETIYTSNFLEKGVLVKTDRLKSFEKYSVNFYEKLKGLTLKKEELLEKYEIVFYELDDFVGKTLKVSDVYYDEYKKEKFYRKNWYFNNTYINIIKKENEVFVGEIFVKTRNGRLYLNEINPVEIEMCSEVVDDVIDLAITMIGGDGLMLDFEHNGVLNKSFDMHAPDIFSFTVNINEVSANE